MTTELGTELGTTLGTTLGAMEDIGPTPPVPTTIASLNPRHRYRASQAALSGGNVVSVPNEGFAGGQLNVNAGTLAAPTADAALNNAVSIAFTGSQSVVSSLPASEFIFGHNGSNCTMLLVASISAVNSGLRAVTLNAATSGTPGFSLFFTTGTTSANDFVGCAVADGLASPNLLQSHNAPGSMGGHIARVQLTAAGSTTWRDGALIGSLSPARAFSTAAPIVGVVIGRTQATTGVFVSNTRFAELLMFDRLLSAPEIAAIDAEYLATYGKNA